MSGRPATEEIPPTGFARALRSRERLLVLYHADWCPFSRAILPVFEALEPEGCVPFARANLRHRDARWDDHGVRVVPTLVYYESGEELERLEAILDKGLRAGEIEDFLDTIEAIQPEPVLPRRMHGPKRF